MTRAALSRLTAGSAFFLLIAGGLVTSTGSGLSVPDWPASFGGVSPDMRGGVFFEHGHRLIAGFVGLLTLALSAWVWATETRRPVRVLAALSLFGIVIQAVLGGLTVLFKLPPQLSIAHACLGQLVFCLLCALADSHSERKAVAGPWAMLACAAFLQLFLGAVLRHTGSGLMLHLLGAGLFTLIAARSGSLHLGVLLLVQLALGMGAYLARKTTVLSSLPLSVGLPTAHLAVGALILASAFVLASRKWTAPR